MKTRQTLLGFLLAVLCLAGLGAVYHQMQLSDLGDVRLPASPTTGHVLSFNGTVWTNAADGGGSGLTNVFSAQFGVVGGTNISITNGVLLTNASLLGSVTLTNLNATLGTDGAGNIVATNGGSAALSALTAAVAANTITNENNAQTWRWKATNATTGLLLEDISDNLSAGWLFRLDSAVNSIVKSFSAGTRGVEIVWSSGYTNQLLCATNGPTVPVIASNASTNTGISFNGPSLVVSANGVTVAAFTNEAVIARSFENIQQELTYTGGTNVSINWTNGNFFNLLITNTTFITCTNINKARSAILHLRQDATGTYAVTFHTNYIAYGDGGIQPTITTNANGRDAVFLISGGEGTNVLAVAHHNFLP